MLTSHERSRLVALLAKGAGLPASRDHATLMLRQADEREARRQRAGYCESGCTAPVITREDTPAPLCGRCAGRMRL